MTRILRAFALGSCLILASAAAAQDWNAATDVETVEIVTHDEDGAARVTTVWLAVYQGRGYVRTGGTKWGANVERDPDVLLRIGGDESKLRAVPIPESDAVYTAVTDLFRKKYGFTDSVMGVLRGLGGAPTIMRLDPR